MTGQRFGSVVAVEPVGSCSSGDLTWSFRCDCGDTFVCSGYDVRSGKRAKCSACVKKELDENRPTHGMTDSPEYRTWTDIKTRCGNPNSISYPRYGGLGIRVCDRWINSFQSFLDDMGRRPSPEHSIDRIDPNGDYEPQNCRWATRLEQANNKRQTIRTRFAGQSMTLTEIARATGVKYTTIRLRYSEGLRGQDLVTTTCRTLTFRGVTDTISGWSKRTGLKPTTISMRVTKYGWPVEKALTEGARN